MLRKFIEKGALNELEEQGMIQAFEYTYELAWNTMKDYYEYQGVEGIQGSRDAIRLAFKRGLIEDGESWLDMINSRKMTSHTYNEDTAKGIVATIFDRYYDLFVLFCQKMKEIQK